MTGDGSVNALGAGTRARGGALAEALRRAGKLGALIARVDWSRTPLGSIQAWPQSLVNYVAMILELPTPAVIFWGADQIQIYNAGYARIMGPRHPRYLGAPYRECWPDTYPLIYPWMLEVLHSGAVKEVQKTHIPLTRYGFNEEAYFTFTFSPLRDDEGAIAGIYQPVLEVTDAVLAERRTQTLHALAPRQGATDAARDAIEALRSNAHDIPFALIFLSSGAGETVELAARTPNLDGFDAVVAAFTERAREAFESRAAVEIRDVVELSGGASFGPWPEPVTKALMLPIDISAGADAGFVVFGVSPRLDFDDKYRLFFELGCGQISRALSGARAIREVRMRADALAELDRAKTTFFSNVSHELRTPLTLILGPTEDALSSPGGTIGGEDLAIVHRNVLRLLKLVNALLDFSRIEGGRAETVREPTDLGPFTADIASGFRSAIERGGLRLEVECPDLPEAVAVDREMWEKIVLNLLSNAFKFTFEGHIRVALRWTGDGVELEVADTGIGIAEHELPRLFERFYRVPGARSRTDEGTGIGLALVHSLVQLHGGRIDADSTPNSGTRFKVWIPKASARAGGAAVPRRRLASTATRAETFIAEALRWVPGGAAELRAPSSDDLARTARIAIARARILVADDNADMREYLARLLGRHWSVVSACDGAEALAAAQHWQPDLVVADVMMPNLDGFALVAALRADPQTAETPVILVSARAGEESTVEGIEAGADDYLVKPFSARELIARVGSQLSLAQGRRERTDLLERERAARQEAELQKQHLASLLMDAPAPIVILRGRELAIELVNLHACRIWGRKHDDVIGRPLYEAVPELRGQVFEQLLGRVYDTGETYVGKETLAKLDWRGDGTFEHVYLTFVYAPLRTASGAVDGVLVLAFDVTDQVRARERVDELRDRAEAASRAKDEFLAMLGHELRNPLAPILTALQLMRLRDDSAFQKERALIERQAGQLTQLVDDLLDVSRITRGKISLQREPVEIADIVDRAIETASPLFEQRRHHLGVHVPRRGLLIDGDPARLAQVVANLLSNAAKYTEPGGRIRVTAARSGEDAVLKVADNGIGISPELLPRIFDMFVQERQAVDRSQGGLGLGLAIARSIVVLHGGSIVARSEGEGRGSELEVRLPLSLQTLVSPKEAARPAPSKGSLAHWKVLVVDDNEDAATTLAEYLRVLGYAVRMAHDGPAALRIATEFVPDAVLLDIGLPAMDGYEVAWRLREQSGFKSVSLVAVTGYGQPSERERTRAAGFDAHLVKPIDLDALARLLEQLSAEA